MDPRPLHDHIIIHEGGDTIRQWSLQETRDLVTIRAELDSSFMETKRSKPLWEVLCTKMKERGYNRSVEQCKSKWKNLVTRYKECETMEQEEGMSHEATVLFYNELQAIFTSRMQRLLWMEPGGVRKRRMADDEDDGSSKKRKKVEFDEILEKFMLQQMQTEMKLMKMYEEREEERRKKEMEWRTTMEELGKERLMLDEHQREREDQRRMREEVRAEKRDALITALLNKLTP